MKRRIPPLYGDILIVGKIPGVHVRRMLKMKTCLYTGENFRHNIEEKSIEIRRQRI